MDAKKHPLFVATLAILGLIAVAGVVLTGLELNAYLASSKKLNASQRTLTGLLSGQAIAPTSENRDAIAKNLAELQAAEAAHRDNLAGTTPASRFEDTKSGGRTPDAGELGSIIKEYIENWRAACGESGVKLVTPKPDEFAFGFSRYFRTGVNPQASLAEVSRQTRIIDFLVKSLLAAKGDETVRLISVEREPIELPEEVRIFNKDELKALPDSTYRRDGLLRGEFFRLRFIARTDVLRRFVNDVTDSGRAVIVRGIDVIPATAELMKDAPDAARPAATFAIPSGVFGEAPAAAEAAPVAKPAVIVSDAPSDITVTFEFIEPTKPAAPVSSTEVDDN